MTKTIAGIFIAICALSVSAQSNQKDLTLRDIYGRSIKLSDYKGKVLLLNFWATWCPPCRTEIRDLIRLQRKYRKDGLKIVGVTYPPETLAAVRKFARTARINYPLALGSESTKAMFTSSDVLPTTVVLDRDGRVCAVIEGILFPEEFDEKIKPLLSNDLKSSTSQAQNRSQVSPQTGLCKTLVNESAPPRGNGSIDHASGSLVTN
jgi:peroxiredoxin